MKVCIETAYNISKMGRYSIVFNGDDEEMILQYNTIDNVLTLNTTDNTYDGSFQYLRTKVKNISTDYDFIVTMDDGASISGTVSLDWLFDLVTYAESILLSIEDVQFFLDNDDRTTIGMRVNHEFVPYDIFSDFVIENGGDMVHIDEELDKIQEMWSRFNTQ